MKSLKSRRRVRRGLLTATGSAAVGNAVGALVAALLIEPRWIHVTRPTVWLPDLPDGWDGLRIAHLTDLHHGRMVRLGLITEAVRLANAESPDLVVLTGDFVSRPGAITTALAKALSKLQAPLGSYAVLGNHDHSADAGGVREMLAAAGIRLLENSHVLLCAAATCWPWRAWTTCGSACRTWRRPCGTCRRRPEGCCSATTPPTPGECRLSRGWT